MKMQTEILIIQQIFDTGYCGIEPIPHSEKQVCNHFRFGVAFNVYGPY
jgi:hypothetical protein